MEPSQLSPEEFEQFRDLIFRLSGIHVAENKLALLSNRIRRRVKATSVEDYRAYLQLLRSPSGRGEVNELLNAVTTNETSFFRTEKHFDWLRTEFVDEMRERARTGQHARSLRIWSAACSSGEEPYSIAMSLEENRAKLAGWSIEIHATDISDVSLSKARAGIYGAHVADEVPEKLRSRYFTRNADGTEWEVKESLKEKVAIVRHNLMHPYPPRDFDCVFVRNVLIYFNRESKQVVIDHLVRSLASGGYLVVGPSEGIFDMLGMLRKRSTFLYQKD